MTSHFRNPQHLSFFNESIHYVFLRWTALQLAIAHSMGGSSTLQKVSLLGTYITDFFAAQGLKIDPYDLEDNLVSFFEESFQAQLEDGSALQVAQVLVTIFRELGEGSSVTFDLVREAAMCMTADTGRSMRGRGDNDGDDDDDDDSDSDSDPDIPSPADSGSNDMEVSQSIATPAPEPVRPGPVFDEDGFEVVQQKGRRRR
ncbi:Pre-rRNA-processing protein TSR2-domain-containing protein [Chytriomyces sp. MP71]|nr:Pre-rRNA-processing protein TSR2-domain-containing protein [Chytriomyces sp. MP71]